MVADESGTETPERIGAAWTAALALLARLPQGALSRAAGRLAELRVPRPLRKTVLGGVASALGMDLAEAQLPVEAYASVGDLFARRLRAGARGWPADAAVAASPVDGVVGRFGRIRGGRALQAKGRDYSVAALLGEDPSAGRYRGGTFVTIYLSPSHYHRIHTPCAGSIAVARHVPGKLLPVNEPAVRAVPELFPRNERMICFVDGELGRVAVVAVGAYNVGRISAEFEHGAAEAWETNRRGAEGGARHFDPAVRLDAGAEIMAFRLGSTVVLLFEPGAIELEPTLEQGREIRVGEPIGRRPSAVSGGHQPQGERA